MKIHDVASMFPPMTADEYAALVDDVRANGQRDPIWTYNGEVIDGRHRLRACEDLGIEPTTREWSGEGSLVAFVLSLNLHRRSLTASQRAAIAAEAKIRIAAEIAEEHRRKSADGGKSAGRGRPKKQTSCQNNMEEGFVKIDKPLLECERNARAEAAKLAHVSDGYAHDASKILDASPETFSRLKSGEVTLAQAKRELGFEPPKPAADQPKLIVRSRVNGELVDDPPRIARLRAAGRIAPGVVPEIIDDPDAPTQADYEADAAERSAIRASEVSDEEWIASLPLSSVLSGRPLAIFTEDALCYRRLESRRLQMTRDVAAAAKSCRYNGAFYHAMRKFLKIDHPKRWVRCSAPDEGGCGGDGKCMLSGKCPKCYGRGYRINND